MVTVRLWRTGDGGTLVERAPGSYVLLDPSGAVVASFGPMEPGESGRTYRTSYAVEGPALVAYTAFETDGDDDTRYADVKVTGLVSIAAEASPVPLGDIEAAIARFKEARDKGPSHYLVAKYTLDMDRVVDPRYRTPRVAFVPSAADPAEALACHRSLGVHIEDIERRPSRAMPVGFWYVNTYIPERPTDAEGPVMRWVDCNVLSSRQMLDRLEQGHTICVVSGPFDTEGAARYDMDVRMESPE